MIYVPNISESSCVVIYDSETIRVYDKSSLSDNLVNYVDYFPKLSYLYKEGSSSYDLDTFDESICIDSSILSTNAYYRLDISDILTSTFIIIFTFLLFVLFVLKCFFRGIK